MNCDSGIRITILFVEIIFIRLLIMNLLGVLIQMNNQIKIKINFTYVFVIPYLLVSSMCNTLFEMATQ